MKKYLYFIVIFMLACSKSNSDYDALVKQQIQCPTDTRLEYRSWGKSGMMALCQIEHGPVIMAEGGRIVIRGENSMGKPSGEWKWYDSSGKVIKIEKYTSD